MAIAYRSSTISLGPSSATAFAKPAGTIAGDFLILFVTARDPITVTASGWTVRATESGEAGVTILTKQAGGSEPSSYSFTITTTASGGNEALGVLAAYSGAASVRGAAGSFASTPSVSSLAFPSVGTGALSDKIVRLGSNYAGSSTSSSVVSPDSGSGFALRATNGAPTFNQYRFFDEDPAFAFSSPTSRSLLGNMEQGGLTATVVLATNVAPNAPTLVSPVTSSVSLNKDAGQRFTWTPSDPDFNDSQSAYDLRYRVVGASSWTTVSASTPNAYRDFAAGTFAAGDYEWQVRTYDALGLVGPYSASSFFTAGTVPAGPAITDPINGQTIGEASYLLVWSSSDQEEYEASILDADGAVVYTSGTVAEAATRSLLLSFPVNSASRTIRLRTRTGGLWSPYSSVTVLVSYTTPAVALASVRPISTISGSTGTDAILVELLNPVPSGGQPAVGSHRIYRRAGTTGDGVRIVVDHPAGQAYVDRTPASGVDYSYRVESIAANGTTSTTEWIGDAVDLGAAPDINDPVTATVEETV